MIREVHDLTEAERKTHEERLGRYNDFPPGWREITEKEFAQAWGFVAALVEFRQMAADRMSPCLSATLFHLHDFSGYAISADYWAGRVRYFHFKFCEHKHTETLEIGRCYRRWKCTDCNAHFAVDSSD